MYRLSGGGQLRRFVRQEEKMKAVFTVAESGTLSAAIGARYPALGKSRLAALIKDRQVRVNGVRVGENIRLSAGDTVEAFLPERQTGRRIRVVYSDDNIVVADKPAHTETAALAALLAEEYGTLYPVHRLDVNTTGATVLARNAKAKTLLERAFAERRVKKTYKAVICGVPQKREGVLVNWLVKEEGRGMVRAYGAPVRGGLRSEAAYKIISDDGETSVVELYPKTGRTHQLRVQLAYIGHPVLGDGKYGNYAMNKKYSATEQKLRAVSVGFGNMTDELAYLSGKEFDAEDEEKEIR